MTPNRRIYRVGPWRRAVLWCLLGPFVALGVALSASADTSTRTAGIVVIAVMAAALAGWEWLMTRTYVALNAEGVELHQVGAHLRAAWPNVVELSLRRGLEGFTVRAPLSGAGAARLAALRNVGAFGAPLYDDAQSALLGERRFIPLDAFAWHLRRGTLAADVARLAPHVRIGDELAPPARANARGLLWTAVIVAAALGLAFGAPDYAGSMTKVLQALAAPLLTLGSGVNAFRALRSRTFLVGSLLAALTLVTLGWTVLSWAELAEWLDS